jgi:hypothetical protein
MDQFYSMFVAKFGQPTSREAVPNEVMSKYSGVLPDSLLAFWKEFGWCSFSEGLVWTVNPDRLHGIFADWIAGISELDGSECIAFARSAFGNLYGWWPRTGSVIRVQCTGGFIMMQKNFREQKKDKDRRIQSFFATAYPKDFDIFDMNSTGLFRQAVNSVGPLGRDEVYGFEPLLVLGGEPIVNNIRKLRMDVHLAVMRQFTDPVLSLV